MTIPLAPTVETNDCELFVSCSNVRISILHMSLSPRVFSRVQSNYLQKPPFTLPKSAYRKFYVTTAKMTVQRITMFKVANEADIPQFFEKYQTLKQDQKKVHQL
jgi:hypothetical protein